MMTDNLETTGYWYFSTDIENGYAGNLIDTNKEFILTLLGCMEVPIGPFLIYGTTATGKKITLSKCFTSGRRMASPGIPSAEISAAYCFTGGHLTFDKFHFDSVLLRVSSLNEWVDISGFHDFTRITNDEEAFAIKYKNPDPITFYKTDDVEFALLFYTRTPIFLPTHNCTITQDTCILIKHSSLFDLDTFWQYATSITSFLTLAYFSEPQIQSIEFKQAENIFEFKYAGQKDKAIKDKSHKRNFLFIYKSIEDNFSKVFKKWTELNVIIEPVINTLTECFGNRNIISENKFLNVMQGIETFHRRRRTNGKESKEFHKKKITDILLNCPPEFKLWLKERLNFSNEPALRERLVELFAELDEDLINHLLMDNEQIIKDAKNSRNYYTHYDEKLEKKALKGKQLFVLTERLKVFLLVLLLKETGISNSQTKKIIIEGSYLLFNHLIDRKKEYKHLDYIEGED